MMESRRGWMVRWVAGVLARLLPGQVGEEARRDLDEEYRTRWVRHRTRAVAWYAGQLLRPSTWSLARALRRKRRREGRPSVSPTERRGPLVSWLDVKLGLRMLAKYPVMTLVSGLAIAVTVALAVATFSLFQDFMLRPDLPLPDGDRIVSLGLRTSDTNRTERRLLHEFEAWRAGLETVEDLGLWRGATHNLVSGDGRGEVIDFATMTASGFTVAGVPPLMGRPLLESDEVDGAEPVVVIGYDEWANRFGSDPDIVGRQVQIGARGHTIVGVMPEGFGFPYSHAFWIPLTDDPDDVPFMEGYRYYAFGRLAQGVTLPQARAEMVAHTEARAELYPSTHGRLRGQVMAYTDTHTGMDDAAAGDMIFVRALLALATLLVLIPFANVAILVYARTATRAGEIAVRTALGASRRRVVTQLFSEALVLAAMSAAAGIGITVFAWGRIERFMGVYFGGGMPFWAQLGQNAWAVAYAAGLVVLAAIVAGVVPGLQATGSRVQHNLKRAAGGNGMRLGKVWTGLVVAQVAITVAFLPIAGWVGWYAAGQGAARATFPVGDLLSAQVAAPPSDPGMDGYDPAASIEEVVRRLEADGRVTGLVLSNRLPDELPIVGVNDFERIEVDGVDPPEDGPYHRVASMQVEAGLFDFVGVPVAAGRQLVPADLTTVPPPVVVNQGFVDHVLGGANAIGRYVREWRPPDEEAAPWREVVGVVGELAENPLRPGAHPARIFGPFDRAGMRSAHLTMRAPSGPGALVADVERTVTDVDPALRLVHAAPMTAARNPVRAGMRLAAAGMGLVLLSVLLLCTAGVFSLMSFNVTQRRREIGIRSALGANPRRVLASVMARSAKQLSVGVALGATVVALTPSFSLDGLPIDRDPRLVLLLGALMLCVGLAAAAGPARSGLRVQPTEALREE